MAHPLKFFQTWMAHPLVALLSRTLLVLLQVIGANSNHVVIGNYGFPADPYGFNIFSYSDSLFRNGFE